VRGRRTKEKALDPETLERLTERVQQIRAGLGPEMEFVAAVNWLSHVLSIHRLEQTPIPKYVDGDSFRVPDVLAITIHERELIPVLIEVKTTQDECLVWSEEYLHSLQRYADAVQMPLLVAWKFSRMWILTDTRHFEKKVTAYHLDLQTALKETLMGELLGDVFIVMNPQLKFFVDATVDGELPPLPAILPAGQHKFTIKQAGFILNDKIIKLSTELFWAFTSAATNDEIKRTAQNEVRIEFTPDPDSMFSLTNLCLMLALWNNKDEEPDWEAILRQQLGVTAKNMRENLQKGIDLGVVRYILSPSPHTKPDFLPQSKEGLSMAE
jgi:Holliday junction resolvase